MFQVISSTAMLVTNTVFSHFNQFLGVGNVAYVVRANIDLTDAPDTFIGIGVPVASTITRVGVGNGTLNAVSATSAFVKPESIDVIFTSPTAFTVQGSISGIIGNGVVGTAFTSTKVNFTVAAGATPFSAGDYFSFDLVYAPSNFTGVGNGTVTDIQPLAAAVPEIISIEMTSPTAFTVSVS